LGQRFGNRVLPPLYLGAGPGRVFPMLKRFRCCRVATAMTVRGNG